MTDFTRRRIERFQLVVVSQKQDKWQRALAYFCKPTNNGVYSRTFNFAHSDWNCEDEMKKVGVI